MAVCVCRKRSSGLPAAWVGGAIRRRVSRPFMPPMRTSSAEVGLELGDDLQSLFAWRRWRTRFRRIKNPLERIPTSSSSSINRSLLICRQNSGFRRRNSEFSRGAIFRVRLVGDRAVFTDFGVEFTGRRCNVRVPNSPPYHMKKNLLFACSLLAGSLLARIPAENDVKTPPPRSATRQLHLAGDGAVPEDSPFKPGRPMGNRERRLHDAVLEHSGHHRGRVKGTNGAVNTDDGWKSLADAMKDDGGASTRRCSRRAWCKTTRFRRSRPRVWPMTRKN